MTAASATRVGWCPGALRPMASRDGFIVRVKPRCATLSPAQAIGIAAAAQAFGNGALDLTSHANLQIRGASEVSLPALTEALDRLGLLDPDVGAETRRNVTMSPLAGLDPEAVFDIRPIVAALEDRLAVDVGLAGLPAKFGFAVSDGGRLPLDDVGADVMFDAGWRSLPETGKVARSAGWGGGELQASPPDTLRVPPSPHRGGIANAHRTTVFAVRLSGDADTVAFCPAKDVPDVAALLAGWFIAARAADLDLRRMRHAVARSGAPAILAAVGLQAEAWPRPSAHPQPSWPGSSWPSTPTDAARDGDEGWGFGVGHLALRAGVGSRDEPGHDGGEAESRLGRLDATLHDTPALDAARRGEASSQPSAHPQPSWPGSSRPSTPTDAARDGHEGWGFGVGHLALRAGVGSRDEPGHDGGEVESRLGRLDATLHDTPALDAARRGEASSQPSAHPQPSWPGSSRPPTPDGLARRGGEEAWRFGVGSLALRIGVGSRDEPGHDGGEAESRLGRLDATLHDTFALDAAKRGEASSQPSAHPQPSWPGSSRPPTPDGLARRGGEEAWRFGVGSLALRIGVGGRDEPGHDGGEVEACHVLGVAAPFGRLDAAQLDTLAQGALRAGAIKLRLAPWRAVLVPGLTRPAAERLAEECAAAGLIVDPGDPRLRVAACAGAPGCHRGTTPVLDHAARWAALLKPGPGDRGILLHVSGCAKGCAHPATAPLTLVAEDGRYRLVTRGVSGPTGLDADAVQSLVEAAGEGLST